MKSARAALLAIGLLMGAVGSDSLAHACGNAVVDATDEAVAKLKLAEKTLDDGDPAAAAKTLKLVAHDLALGAPKVGTDRLTLLYHRAYRIFALAVLRTDGRLDDGSLQDPKTTEGRERNLAWARGTLQRLVEIKGSDGGPQTDLAEALERSNAGEAKRMLEDLARRDVVSTPYGYAALARLRAASGDAEGRAAALGRCTAMAKVASICEAMKPKS